MTIHPTTPVQKTRYPLALAQEVAASLLSVIQPACLRALVVGSIRRQRPDVGDIEILYIPTMETRPADLLYTQEANLADEAIQRLLDTGVLEKRANVKGSAMWGHQNKFAVHVATGIPVDLFQAQKHNWYNLLVCRTGPAASNARIATLAIGLGWKWAPYSRGFANLVTGALLPVLSEEEVYAHVGLPCPPPEQR